MDFSLRYDQTKSTHRISAKKAEEADLPNRFLRALELRGLSRHTVRAYGYDLVVFLRWMKQHGKNLKSLTEADLMEFIALHRDRNAAPKTINRRLIASRLIYQFAFDKPIPSGHGASRPSRHFIGKLYDPYLGIIRVRRSGRLKMRVQEPKKLIEPLTSDQVNAFLRRVTRYRDIVIVFLMLLCGLRSHEVISVTLPDISFSERQMRIRGKGNKQRMVPFPDLLAGAIRKYQKLERPEESTANQLLVILQGRRRGCPMTSAGLRSIFRQRRKHPLLKTAHAHKWRHTFGADMVRAGVTLTTLQILMGHSSLIMTRHYSHLCVEDVKEEYDRAIERLKGRYAPNLKN